MFAMTVNAADEHSWTDAADPTVAIEEEPYQPSTYAGEHCSPEKVSWKYWHREGYAGPKTLETKTEEQCVTSTAFGDVTSHGFLRFKGEQQVYHADIDKVPVNVPNAESYFYVAGIGNGNAGLFAIDNPMPSFEIGPPTINGQGVHYEKEYFLKEGVETRDLKDSAGNYVSLRNIDASSNGEWLVGFRGNGRAVRIDPKTFAMLTFPAEFPQYGPFSQEKPIWL